MADSDWLTVADLARRWKQSEDTIRRKIAAGDIPAVRLGEFGPLRVPAGELEKHLRPARRTEVATRSSVTVATPRSRGSRETA